MQLFNQKERCNCSVGKKGAIVQSERCNYSVRKKGWKERCNCSVRRKGATIQSERKAGKKGATVQSEGKVQLFSQKERLERKVQFFRLKERCNCSVKKKGVTVKSERCNCSSRVKGAIVQWKRCNCSAWKKGRRKGKEMGSKISVRVYMCMGCMPASLCVCAFVCVLISFCYSGSTGAKPFINNKTEELGGGGGGGQREREGPTSPLPEITYKTASKTSNSFPKQTNK